MRRGSLREGNGETMMWILCERFFSIENRIQIVAAFVLGDPCCFWTRVRKFVLGPDLRMVWLIFVLVVYSELVVGVPPALFAGHLDRVFILACSQSMGPESSRICWRSAVSAATFSYFSISSPADCSVVHSFYSRSRMSV